MPDILTVVALDAYYDAIKVLHGVALSVRKGSVTVILGANGAGKTTTLRAICGLIRAEGQIEFDGVRIDGRSTESIVRLGIAHVPEGRGTFANMSVEENLMLGAYVRKDRARAAEDLARVFDRFPRLKERRRQQAGTLSGGEQQMLAISRALMLRPRLLLMDEPSFGLAPLIVQEIFEIMRAINLEDGVSLLLVEQNATLALALADHAYLLETGRMALSGPSAEMQQNQVVRQAYLGY